jgi:hypothetical protein
LFCFWPGSVVLFLFLWLVWFGLVLVLAFCDRVSLCSSDCPRTFDFLPPPQPPECWDYRYDPLLLWAGGYWDCLALSRLSKLTTTLSCVPRPINELKCNENQLKDFNKEWFRSSLFLER